MLPTGADYAWKAKVVGTDTALNNEDNGGTLLDHDRYKAPTPKPSSSAATSVSLPLAGGGAKRRRVVPIREITPSAATHSTRAPAKPTNCAST